MRKMLLATAVFVLAAAHHQTGSAQGRPVVEQGASAGLLLIVSMDESKVDIVDESTLKTVASLNTGKGPHEVRVAPDGRSAYVVAGRTITAIDIPNRAVRATFDLGDGLSAHDVRVSRDGKRLWAACAAAQTVVELDTGQRVVVAMIKSLAVFEIASGRLIREIPLPANPKVLALSGDGRRAYLTNPEANSATIVDLDDGRVTTLPAGKRPDGIAWAPNPVRIR